MAGSEVGADLWLKEYITPWDVYEHGVSEILVHQKTPYQEMYIIETGAYGKALVLDGKWQSCTGDEFLYHESLVQPACIAHRAPKTALILGGGEGATAREILRWRSIEQVVMVDLDGAVVDACKQHLSEMHGQAFDDPRLEVVIGDALDYVAACSQTWDIIISDLSDPIEEGPAFQLFTQEFFGQLKALLAPQGYCVIQAGSVAVGEITLHARLINTLRTVFADVVSYNCAIPTFAVPWGFALCAEHKIETRPNPEQIDRLLAEQTTGGLQLIDGVTLLGLLQTPKFVHQAIATHKQIYTLADPPKFFGKGIVEPT
ncbi:MAG: spermidine synthase [Spirulina sp. SIO3F2]|nr:spermidine synthase [Spirulina sp. SIO3F2]